MWKYCAGCDKYFDGSYHSYPNRNKPLAAAEPVSDEDFRIRRIGHLTIARPLLEHTNAIIAEKKQQIETIEEYKKSLIFEYVTGNRHCT